MPTESRARVAGLDPARLESVAKSELIRYEATHPEARKIALRNENAFYAGVPMHWMLDWGGPFPLVAIDAQGAALRDVDGVQYADFCLGDTGAMFGHSPPQVVRALQEHANRGFTMMMPNTLASDVGRLLRERFSLPYWQLATTASDANRFALRIAREVTQRPKIVVMNGCYHGAVDETYVQLEGGRAVNLPSLLGQAGEAGAHTKVIEFNDIAALEQALAPGDVACVITEPLLTNCGMVLPQAGYHEELRRLTRAHGTLLLIDETHTLSSGPRGYSHLHGLDPDFFVVGKAIAAGLPAAAWGFTEAVAAGWTRARREKPAGHSGLGTTLSGNALTLAVLQVSLTQVMTESAYRHIELFAARLEKGLRQIITARSLPWHVVRAGGRVEYIPTPEPLKNGGEALRSFVPSLERAIRLGLLNRGVLITPFHNMMLVSPVTLPHHVESLLEGFDTLTELLLRTG